jgi:hypothetical protein
MGELFERGQQCNTTELEHCCRKRIGQELLKRLDNQNRVIRDQLNFGLKRPQPHSLRFPRLAEMGARGSGAELVPVAIATSSYPIWPFVCRPVRKSRLSFASLVIARKQGLKSALRHRDERRPVENGGSCSHLAPKERSISGRDCG